MFRDMKIFTRSKWRFVQFFYFPVTTVIIWGLFAIFARSFSPEAGLMVLAVNIFWSFSYLAQSTTNMQINEDHWSGSFRQVMSSGFTEFEYIFARIITSSLVSVLIMLVMLSISMLFGLTMLAEHGWLVFVLSSISLLGSVALSIIVAALILLFGREYSFLAWTILQVFILLSAPLYPLEILPDALKYIALVMPFTNIFAGVRELISTGGISPSLLANGFGVALVYLAVSIPLYYYSFRRAQMNGMLARMY
jgi:ABC-2 type transport system permease protein